MTVITEELLRKRAEHNDGALTDLKEITLHQYEIEVIGPLLHQRCKELEILYLQNNQISKIENVYHLKNLKYFNLAVNNVERIENLESNEALVKLDLTVNYVEDITCVKTLQRNYNLRELFLMGNPCTQYEGWTEYVIATLPQLKELDGDQILPSQRIIANEMYEKLKKFFDEESPRIAERAKERATKGAEYSVNEKGETLYGNDSESRKAAAHALNDIREKNGANGDRSVDASKIGEVDRIGAADELKRPKLTPEEQIAKYGRILQKNEGKWDFKFIDEDDQIVLDVPVGKYMSTSSIDIDLQPSYVILNIKGKYLQLIFPEEVKPSECEAQRSKSTGNLKLVMPKEKKDEILRKKVSLSEKKHRHAGTGTLSVPNRESTSLRDEHIGTSETSAPDIHNIAR